MLTETQLLPDGYVSTQSLGELNDSIHLVKTVFESNLARRLNLKRVSSPLFLESGTGVNDQLNGIEAPVSFQPSHIDSEKLEIVHSLAKWKRTALAMYEMAPGSGLVTDMKAIRKDEEVGPIHSIYVDQWDWEQVIDKHDRHTNTLRDTVRIIYACIKDTEAHINREYPALHNKLPEHITFITSQELEDRYPNASPKQREDLIAEQFKAVFIEQIGGSLRSGMKHDGRSPDYDDWQLNGDIILWNPVLQSAFEVSSMGIRVDEEALLRQLKLAGNMERVQLDFHRSILERRLPYSIGGGIGQSRLCMFLLEKAHIGEIQHSVWPKQMRALCESRNVRLL
ncbi:aspartate-ammonia ligase [Paenibacillus cellulosilyticus]|uniref:Aspartate--ammonia ligase n=1 Tax=Paenibacillus cellulosilyticus TaxID=375489 RepID=A0A2V2YPB6_9BACL|nr:aspartate--ammonia ligase [Paenibacillus cellulosilyticus]PWV94274.1 aspartate-ammonia ligase [Paenibacillus cellulosilyticus]QKS44242.1 aspartate--ammonia ligase [Paenibacillus cellulosilyticus]